MKTSANLDLLEHQNLPKGYRAYKIKGVDQTIIARKGGPTSDQVKSKATYAELRNNQKEFGVASMMSKVLRSSLSDGMSEICETYVSGRLTAQFRNLAKYEQGKTGTRPLYLSKHGHNLNGFEFNTTAPYEQIFGAKYFIKPGSRRGQVILHFPAFVPENTFQKPDGATNFKISARLIALSDYYFDQEEMCYQPLSKDFHGQFGAYKSPMLPILKIPTEPMTAMVSLDEQEVPEHIGLFLVMAVSFYQYENGKFKHLAKGSSMTIKKVY
ncbi:hypothetical protein [Marinoscillum furvescens]|uniref:Uncharacterized protein n=1 Tax=Marinoscillum furvescens DSM 4134 TaxID=1122208 RepID=A0A3D9KZE5_MARFU|nr:hypothetical protein [Marinoscillum furvescens]RED95660.1 hypothetical protein C7460_117110 [Marinoscillum furvescens DSM 4134]